jgi:hypothetical protein
MPAILKLIGMLAIVVTGWFVGRRFGLIGEGRQGLQLIEERHDPALPRMAEPRDDPTRPRMMEAGQHPAGETGEQAEVPVAEPPEEHIGELPPVEKRTA